MNIIYDRKFKILNYLGNINLYFFKIFFMIFFQVCYELEKYIILIFHLINVIKVIIN